MMIMEILSPISAATAMVVIFLAIVYYFMKNRDILPGPRGWPYLGLYPMLTDEKCHLQLQEIGKKYGDLFSFTFTGKLIINLGSARAMREILVNKSDCFAKRFTTFNILTDCLEDVKYSVLMSNGEVWMSLRKFFIKSFKEYGLSMENTTGSLYDSVSETIEDCRSKNGEPFNVIDLLTDRCTTSMRKILFGYDAVSAENMRKMNAATAISLEGMTGVKLLLLGPAGKFIFNTLPALRKALAEHKVLRDLLLESVKSIEANMDDNHPTCVVEDYYKERNIRKRQNDPSWKHFSDKALVSSLAQIAGDGILSVAYFIGMLLHALIKYPDEQGKIYKEIMEVVGPSRIPTVEDKTKLTYTNAFMNEVVRTSNFFPLFPSMECTKETTVRGYRIPKGSIAMLNIWQAHHDPEAYDNPDKFDPYRFIPSDGKPRAELPVQFGMGKRACTGESFVTTEIFLFLTSIVKNFIISEPKKPQMKSELFLMTGYMELCLHPRTEK